MNSKKTFVDFSATEVPLNSSNLIEASAGTGKTYSIAILVLRLLLEKGFSIKEILMVTFTKAAVAELEERIRLFLRVAYKAAIGENIEDKSIKYLVDNAIVQLGQERVKEILEEGKLLLDETSVMTIHSFCQQNLNEFAFETNQLFGSETLLDTSSLILDEVNKFWRRYITVLDPVLLGFLLPRGLSRDFLTKVINNHLAGQRYIEYDPKTYYSLTKKDEKEALEKIVSIENEENKYLNQLFQDILDSANDLIERCEKNKAAIKNILPIIGQPEEFIAFLSKERGKVKYISDLFSDWLEKIDIAVSFQERIMVEALKFISLLYKIAIQTSEKNIIQYKEKNSVLTFNDMIVKLHTALTKNNNINLVAGLQNKYKAVFIDEFQDTDKLQYEIFKSAFGNETILFYIGDPKQSIYAWRQADLNTYFKASHEVTHKYGMNQNYRSSERFIKAMNLFFYPTEGFDTFYFPEEEDSIDYFPVDSPTPNRKGILLNNGQEEVPITIFENTKKDELQQTVCEQIIRLLKDEQYCILKNDIKRRIKPSDIGIIIRTNREGKEIKQLLAKYGVPAITIDDSKVLQSQEATYLFYLLCAFLEPSQSLINRALLSPFTGFTRVDILQLNQEKELQSFKKYGLLWENVGIYVTLTQFIIDYNIKNRLLNDDGVENGERIITNLNQLVEILHKVQSSKNFSQIELVNWLKRGMEGMKVDGDEYEQRVESDMEAVQIVTIHKSKGLEYNIVFAPFLDLKSEITGDFCSLKDSLTGEYLFGLTENLEEEQRAFVKKQLEQENRRLLYVAITRAVYKCYISRNMYFRDNTTLIPFVNTLKNYHHNSELIAFSDGFEIESRYYIGKYQQNNEGSQLADNFELREINWRKLSYSFLTKKSTYIPKPATSTDLKDYEYFIFKQLVKGNITGNLIHYIFENIDFTTEQYWAKHVNAALVQFMPKQLDNYKEPLLQFLQIVLNTNIIAGNNIFKLSQIENSKRLNELEFDFNVPVFNTRTLNTLSNIDNRFVVNPYGELEGVMNGKVDLFFEHKGQFYILDWKSNYLGDTIEDYAQEHLNTAMEENNYHLQYLIYTVAVKKYLEQRLPGFEYEKHFGGVIYLFLRGLRNNSDHGIYVRKPAIEQIEKLENIISYRRR